MQRIASILAATVLLWLLWLALTGSTDPQELLTGALIAFVVALIAGGEPFGGIDGGFLNPRRILYAMAYIPYMIWAIVAANFDVARRVVDPKLPINPGIVRVRTKLKTAIGRTALANSITLTPGTLTVDVHDDELWIHWVDVQSHNIEEATQAIVAGFEKYLEVIFG